MSEQRRQIITLFTICFIALAIIVANVFIVSVGGYHLYTGVNFKERAQSFSYYNEKLEAKRGNIYDNQNEIIATNRKSYILLAYINPKRQTAAKKPAYVEDKKVAAQKLSKILNASEDYIYKRLTSMDSKLDSISVNAQVQFGFAGSSITEIQKQAIEELNMPGFEFIPSLSRYYPLDNLASNLVGFAALNEENGKINGQLGIEKLYNKELTGVDGSNLVQKDGLGYVINNSSVNYTPAVNGNDIHLTINKSIQESLQLAFESTKKQIKATNMFGAVMEVETGRVVAWGQNPDYNINDIENSVFINYGVDALFEPGSTFKAFTYAAAIDSGNYDGSKKFDSSPFYLGLGKNREPYRANEPTNHGVVRNALERQWGYITFDEGFKYSSNVGTATLLVNMGSKKFKEYIQKFGFLKSISTDRMNTRNGSINYDWPIEKVNTTFGQGITVNILQMLQGYSAILNDGKMVKPYFIDQITNAQNDIIYKGHTEIVGQPIKSSTSKKLIELMRYCVTEKDGYCNIYNIDSSEVIAKTGTSQIVIDGKYSQEQYITSVVAALPAKDPKVLVYYGFQSTLDDALYSENREGVKNLLKTMAIYYDRKDTTSNVNNKKDQVSIVEVPHYTNHSLEFSKIISNENLVNVVILGDGKQVVKQVPAANEQVLNNQRVFLLTDSKNIKMPNMLGWSLKDVTNFYALTGIEIVTVGNGSVISQSVNENTDLKDIKSIKVVLR